MDAKTLNEIEERAAKAGDEDFAAHARRVIPELCAAIREAWKSMDTMSLKLAAVAAQDKQLEKELDEARTALANAAANERLRGGEEQK